MDEAWSDLEVSQDQLDASRWSKGRYDIIGDWLAPASRACLEGLPLAGRRLLDVATGTGTVAIAAAERGAQVEAVDVAEVWLDLARQRAIEAGVRVDFRRGSFFDLSASRGFDVVTSAFGVMLAYPPAVVMHELLATLRPRGLARIAAWAPDGVFGGVPSSVRSFLPGMSLDPDPTRWVTPPRVLTMLTRSPGRLIDVQTRRLWLRARSLNHLARQLRAYSAPWIAMFDAVESPLRPGLMNALVQHLEAFAEDTTDGVRLRLDYGITTVQRSS